MHYAISTKVQGQTHMWNVLKHIWSNFLNFSLFMCFWIFTHTKQKYKSKIKCKNNQNNAYKEMRDAQMHDNEPSNAWRVLQRSKELDQGSKKQKLNHKSPSSSKRKDCLEWVSHEKWEESWKNENQRCI